MVIIYTLNCKSLRKDSKQKDLLFFLQSRKPPRLVSDDEEMYNFVPTSVVSVLSDIYITHYLFCGRKVLELI